MVFWLLWFWVSWIKFGLLILFCFENLVLFLLWVWIIVIVKFFCCVSFSICIKEFVDYVMCWGEWEIILLLGMGMILMDKYFFCGILVYGFVWMEILL